VLICLLVLGGPMHRCIFVFSTWVFDWGFCLLFPSPSPSSRSCWLSSADIYFFLFWEVQSTDAIYVFIYLFIFPSSWVFFIGGFVFCPPSPPFSKPVSHWGWRRTWVHQQKLLIRPTGFTMNSAATISSKS
jgi:hypothetical protein